MANPNISEFDLNSTNLTQITEELKNDGFFFGQVPPSGIFNTLLKEHSEGLLKSKFSGVWEWEDTTTSDRKYNKGALVEFQGKIYKSLSDNNTSIPNVANWVLSDGSDAVKLTGDQTIDDVKTFLESPKVPEPTESDDATNKEYVDSKIPSVTETLFKIDKNSSCFKKINGNNVSIKAGTVVATTGGFISFDIDTPLTMPLTFEQGQDYAVFINPDGSDEVLKDPFETPAVPTNPDAVLIGGFHYGFVSPTETVAGGAFATTGNGMIWTQSDVDKIKGINEYSFWDLRFRRKGKVNIPGSPRNGQFSNHGFALDPHTGKWIGIYFLNPDTDTYGLSRALRPVASGTVAAKIPRAFGGDGTAVYTARNGLVGPGNWWDFQEILASQGAIHPSEIEFNSFAFGTTEQIVLGGAAVTIPESKREAGYTSRIGVEQVTGHMWIWSRDNGSSTTGTWTNNNGGRGQQYTSSIKALLGGRRSDSAATCGSRAVHWGNASSFSIWSIVCRASGDLLIL